MLTIYKASAGSGKTYTLALEYIKVLLGIKTPEGSSYTLNGAAGHRKANRHRGILAITFTNKATDEMKQRIIRELDSLGRQPEQSPYTATLCRCFGCSADQLAAEARFALADVLNDYHYFNVSTIDSFFQLMLRTFARELDQQGDYELELDSNYAIKAGVEMLFDDLSYGNAPQEKQIEDWLLRYIRRQIAEGKSYNVFDRRGSLAADVVSYVYSICNEDFKPLAADVADYLSDPGRIRRYTEAVARRRNAILTEMKAKAQAALRAAEMEIGLNHVNNTILGILQKAADGILPEKKFLEPGNPEKGKTVKAVLAGSQNAAKLYKALKEISPTDALRDTLTDAVRTAYNALISTNIIAQIQAALPALEFLGLAERYVAEYRRDNNLVLISDTNDLVRRIINGADVPFIYERVGMELHHFLIDEFQDTSVMQWQNLQPLVANGLTDRADSLIIGDEKQAIYRWRNSDSSLLHHRVAQDDFPSQHTLRGADPADNTNHRSAHGIVRFNNALFSRLALGTRIDGYENVRQSLDPSKSELSSYVRFVPYSTLGEDGAKAEELKEAAMHDMAREIMAEHERGYRWSEIAILLRKRKETRLVTEFLLARYPEIPLLSNEGLLLNSSPAVRLIVSVLKFVDRTYKSTVGEDADADERPYKDYGDILMLISRFEYAVRCRGLSPEDALEAALGEVDTDSIDTEALGVRSNRPANLTGLVEVIVQRNIPADQREREFAYIAAFQDVVLKYCETFNPSIHAFLKWWSAHTGSLTLSAGGSPDAINILTIHKAKGLEWPCVHIPVVSWELENHEEAVWLPMQSVAVGDPADRPPVLRLNTQLLWSEAPEPFAGAYREVVRLNTADNMNVTYVAFTRPGRELHVYYDSTRNMGREIDAALHSTDPSDSLPEGLPLPEYCTESGVFVFGAPTSSTAPDDSTDTLPEPVYNVSLRSDTRELTTVDDITSLDPEAADELDEQQLRMRAAADRGTDLHAILAMMETAADLDRALATFAQFARPGAAKLAEYRRVLTDAFASADPLIERWFAPGAQVLVERGIYLPAENVNRRADRVVIYDDGSADIIDYKFTAFNKSELREHSRQVNDYRRALTGMGFSNVRAWLWYVDHGRIVAVDRP